MNDPCDQLMQFFTYKYLKGADLQEVGRYCCDLADYMVKHVPHNPELTVGLRKLLEAKDCFVRAKLYKEEL